MTDLFSTLTDSQAATLLRERAATYWQDADTLRRDPALAAAISDNRISGDAWAVIYSTVAAELRKIADSLDGAA